MSITNNFEPTRLNGDKFVKTFVKRHFSELFSLNTTSESRDKMETKCYYYELNEQSNKLLLLWLV